MKEVTVEVAAPRNREERRKLAKLINQGARIMNTTTTEPIIVESTNETPTPNPKAIPTFVLTAADLEALTQKTIESITSANSKLATEKAKATQVLKTKVVPTVGKIARALPFTLAYVGAKLVKGVVVASTTVASPFIDGAKIGYGK